MKISENMDLGLKGRLALVTGSTSGLGKAIAEALAAEGADVIINGRWSRTVGDVAYEIEHKFNHKIRAHQLVCDAVSLPQTELAFEEKIKPLGKLDILVNNIGGISGIKTFEEISDEEWNSILALNLSTPVRFISLALPCLKKSDQARIINISSAAALQPGKNNPHYLAAKASLVTLSKYLADDLAKYNILVNTVCPNTIKGGAWFRDIKNMSANEGISLEEAAVKLEDSVKKKVPLNRVGTMEEVANVVAFLASKKASFINGECIFVDGGSKRSIF